MKVIHFIRTIDKTAGGTTAYMQLLSAELKNLSELVVVAGYSPTPVELSGVKIQFFNLNLIRWFSIRKKFSRFLKTEKPDVVHINGIWTPQNYLFQKEAQKLGIKVILSPHGMLDPYILTRHLLKKKIALSLYQNKAVYNADYIHATAQPEYDQIRKLGYNQPIAIIPNGIDLSEIKPKTNWRIVQNILFLSRVHPQKGIELLINAVAQLNNNNISLTIAGQGEPSYLDILKKQIDQKGISHLTKIVGGVYGNSKWELFRNSDILILPSYSECFGIVVAEALATGIPVITTTGTPWHELQTQQCGWWIDLTIQNLTNTLNKAINTNPQELKAMGLRGRKLVEEKYDIKAVGQEMNIFYKWILNKENKPEFIND